MSAPDTETEARSPEDRLAEATTPMMRQYLSVKAAYPHALVLFRMGDFYEAFFEDAEACARLLDITLTARSKERDVKMAGVPHHAVEGYLARLIEQGQTVVIVDQVEDPRQAKGLVRREVTRILSPGTFLDPNAPARAPNYLAALGFGAKKRPKEAWGLAILDLSTGEFRATAGRDPETLTDELTRPGLRELVVSEKLREDPRLAKLRQETGLATAFVADTESEVVLTRILGATETKAAQTLLEPEAVTAAALALAYVEASQLRPEAPDVHGKASLAHVRTLTPYEPGSGLILDAQAREHLELFQSRGEGGRKGSLLWALDAAITAMGGRLLVRWLAYPLRNPEQIRQRQDAVAALVQLPSALDVLRDALKSVADLERLVGRVALGRANPRDLVLLARTLAQAPKVLQAAAQAAQRRDPFDFADPGQTVSAKLALLAGQDVCADVAASLSEALVDEPPVELDGDTVFRLGFDPELDRLEDIAKNGKDLLAQLEQKEREATGIGSLKIRFNKVFGYYLEVTKTNLKLVPSRYIRKQTTVNSERFFTEELKTLETEVLSAEERRIERTVVLFNALMTQLGAAVPRLSALAATLAELDVLAAFARIAEERGWVRPVVDDGDVLELVDARHPVLELLSGELGERFVPNDVTLSEAERLMIVTGPNMAGKSTIMRQTALIAVLAHMGAFVPAKSARLGWCDRVFTRVGASDDLSRGRSTFMVEMAETARILRAATPRSLVLMDEIGRGTSTFDGLSIAWAVAEHLHDVARAKTLFATHYHELTEICRDKSAAVNRHVAVKEWNDQIVFLRKLLPGATNKSYGVQVARLAGLPPSVLARARAVLDSLEAQSLSAGDHPRVTPHPASPQLHLFEVAQKPAKAVEHPVLEALRGVSIDTLTPLAALNLLAEWRRQLASK